MKIINGPLQYSVLDSIAVQLQSNPSYIKKDNTFSSLKLKCLLKEQISTGKK